MKICITNNLFDSTNNLFDSKFLLHEWVLILTQNEQIEHWLLLLDCRIFSVGLLITVQQNWFGKIIIVRSNIK